MVQLKGKVMEKITLSTNLVNAIIGYLGTRPYQEVFQLVEAMQKEAKEHGDQENNSSAS
jgi:hypothetical protein